LFSFDQFNRFYQDVVDEVYAIWTPQMQDAISRHNRGWAVSNFDFHQYFKMSSIRYYYAYRDIDHGRGKNVCDVGGFWGIFPITLIRAGFQVTMTESLQYYGTNFDRLFEFIREQGVEIIDYDPFQAGNPLPKKFDAVTVMAVLEHYPHSLKIFMDNIKSMLNTGGSIYIEVPNIAYWPKRLAFLLGRSPLVPIDVIYDSEVPFTGHHHEFEKKELDILLQRNELKILEEHFYSYSAYKNVHDLVKDPLGFLINSIFKKSREVISLLCTPKS
jgi:2-polyprenyl-3-methyl-5-hydroxy-6-metoxy-1,4-benzoquinol methylase